MSAELAHVVEHDRLGPVEELGARKAAREGQHAHAGGVRRFDGGTGVLGHGAGSWRSSIRAAHAGRQPDLVERLEHTRIYMIALSGRSRPL